MNSIIYEDARNIANSNLSWDKLNGKTILISGANGYVPSYFVHALMARNDMYNSGIKVIALCRNEEKAKERFNDYLNRSDFSLLIQDVCDPIKTSSKIHYFINAASPASMHGRFAKPVSTFLANTQGCGNMLKLSLDNPVEGFLLVSSVDIYGNMANGERLREDDIGTLDLLNTRNVYSCGKRAAEVLAYAYYTEFKTPIVIARPFQVIAPGIALDDGRLHADFISQILSGDKIVLKSDGSAKRTFMYITDAMEAMLRILTDGERGAAYNVVSESGEATVLELAKLFAVNTKSKKVEVVFDYEKRNAPEVTKAISVVTGASDKLRNLGWSPKISLNEAVMRMMKYYGL
jgi:nucleoside-diphosphate-sugar epimerase